MKPIEYEQFVRTRITELRLAKNVSEHRMSLDLDKSGSYIRSITSGAALPSLRELFRIMAYLDVTPPEFFAPLEPLDSEFQRLIRQLGPLEDAELKKVSTFVEWIHPDEGHGAFTKY